MGGWFAGLREINTLLVFRLSFNNIFISNFRCTLVPFMPEYIWVLIYLESIVQQVSCSNPPYPPLISRSYSGMSALMRKELLENAGGIQAFGCYLAEDFFFAKSILVRKFDPVILLCHHLFFRNKITNLR